MTTTIDPLQTRKPRDLVAFWWLFGAAVASFAITLFFHASTSVAFDKFPFQVIAIFVALELYTDLVRQTGLMDRLAVVAARSSGARGARVLVIFGALLMGVGVVNNNMTALVVTLPILIAVLRALRLKAGSAHRTFAMLLAVGNCAGAATPVGDFPALLIMAAGVTTFATYLVLAFPLFLMTAGVLVLIYRRLLGRDAGVVGEPGSAAVALRMLEARHRNHTLDTMAIVKLAFVFAGMAACWIVVPARTLPPALVAWGGLATATLLVAPHGIKAGFREFDLDAVMRIMAVFFVASLLSTTSLVGTLADALTHASTEPLPLLLLVMTVTMVASAVIDAGGAAAALLPIVVQLTRPGAPLGDVRSIAVVAFAAAICAGSSVMLTSATAGQLLSSKVKSAALEDQDGGIVRFDFRTYLPYGLLNATVQFSIAVGWVVAALALTGRLS